MRFCDQQFDLCVSENWGFTPPFFIAGVSLDFHHHGPSGQTWLAGKFTKVP
jgi:hypothetical protein